MADLITEEKYTENIKRIASLKKELHLLELDISDMTNRVKFVRHELSNLEYENRMYEESLK